MPASAAKATSTARTTARIHSSSVGGAPGSIQAGLPVCPGGGKVQTSRRVCTLYVFTKDGRNRDVCASIPGCPSTWSPLRTSGKALAGRGVKASLIGTITLKNGTKQVTYGGHPLYTYSGDSGPGQTSYVDFPEFGRNWPAVNAAGKEVK